MTTLQEYLNQKYPTKGDKEKELMINLGIIEQEIKEPLEGGDLDLKGFTNVERVIVAGEFLTSPITKINVDCCNNLKSFGCSSNNLTSIDFLNQLPNPEKLDGLAIFSNKIQPTDISFFSRFINLRILKLGTGKENLKQGKHNKFHGSFKSWKDLSKLREICIEATDVNEGLEYLPFSLIQEQREKTNHSYYKKYNSIECSPHNTNAKCSAIQNQLRPYDYDIEAWQLAHPHLMYEAKPELFFDPNTKSKWLTALRDKVNQTQTKLDDIKQNEPEKIKKVKRLESKVRELNLVQKDISNNQLINKLQEKELIKKENKVTQTEELVDYKIPGSWPK